VKVHADATRKPIGWAHSSRAGENYHAQGSVATTNSGLSIKSMDGLALRNTHWRTEREGSCFSHSPRKKSGR
jgi:hypothetical protein